MNSDGFLDIVGAMSREDAKYSTVAINIAANRFGPRGIEVESSICD
jgi:hypothetical protein